MSLAPPRVSPSRAITTTTFAITVSPGRWACRAYDNRCKSTVPKPQDRHLQEQPTVEALAAATRFGLKAPGAKAILGEVFAAVSGWRKCGRQLRLKANTLDAYTTAFEHPLMEEAKRPT